MSTKKETSPQTPVPAGNLEAKVKELAEKHGLTGAQVQAVMRGDFSGASVAAGAGTEAWGDGVLLGKIFGFIKELLPILLPIIIGMEEGTAAPGTPA